MSGILRICIFISIMLTLVFPDDPLDFDDYFLDKTLRVDYYHTGDANEEFFTVDQIYEQGMWPGNPDHLLDPFNNGKYYLQIYDLASNRLIYSMGYNTYFAEYQTTDPALQGIKKTFHETVRLPLPKNPVQMVIAVRDKKNMLHPAFIKKIDPDDLHIIKEEPAGDVQVFRPLKNGDPHQKVDIVILAEGYTAAEEDKFKKDLRARVDLFFEFEPFTSNKDRFNFYGVFNPSAQSGADQPRRGIFANTTLNASFNALDLERYLLTEDNRGMRNLAAHVPYDAICIMVNSDRYGGGGIYNQYAIFTSDGPANDFVAIHEFGHSFAGLADEYYASTVAYNDFYPKGVEPTEPNITALLVPERPKWPVTLADKRAVPTDWNKARYDSLQSASSQLYEEWRKKKAAREAAGTSEEEIDLLRDEFDKKRQALRNERNRFMPEHPLKNDVGFFEGAGYASGGLYRPMLQCLMFSNDKRAFCRICQKAIQKMIDFYSGD